jgi:nonsense-mediated mRNA decay protein 3
MICVECGNESEIIKNGLCINCFIKSVKFSEGPNIFNIIQCSNCNSYKYRSKWLNQSLNEIINKLIIQKFKINDELKKIKTEIYYIEDKQYKKKVEVIISGSFSNKKIIEKHIIQINIKKEICEICSKQFGGYHEAIIQIRADKRNLTDIEIEGIYTYVQDYVKNIQNKGNKNIFIADFEIKQNGITFFMSDNTIALSITKKLQEMYSGEIKKSSKYIGMKEGKQIYRMTYLLRLHPYNKGDIITHKKKFYYVNKILKNKIYLIDLKNWGENIFNIKDLNNFILKGRNELVKNMIFVSQTNDELQIMDKNSYKIYIIKKPKNKIFDSDMIKIIQIQDKIFLLPIQD